MKLYYINPNAKKQKQNALDKNKLKIGDVVVLTGELGSGKTKFTEGFLEYYNLQGVKVENPSNGIFIKKQGTKATKVVL